MWGTDNTTGKSCTNRQGTMSSELAPLCGRLMRILRDVSVDLAARHIKGEDNDLADGLSRHMWEFTAAD